MNFSKSLMRKLHKDFEYSQSDFLELDVKKSLIPNAGVGLFCDLEEGFKPGHLIGEYRGRFMKDEEENDYSMTIKGDKRLVVGTNVLGLINDIIDYKPLTKDEIKKACSIQQFDKLKGFEYNCKFVFSGKKVFVGIIKEVKDGEELYCDYSFPYWLSKYLRDNKNNFSVCEFEEIYKEVFGEKK